MSETDIERLRKRIKRLEDAVLASAEVFHRISDMDIRPDAEGLAVTTEAELRKVFAEDE